MKVGDKNMTDLIYVKIIFATNFRNKKNFTKKETFDTTSSCLYFFKIRRNVLCNDVPKLIVKCLLLEHLLP